MKVSLLIPIYKVENYVARCVESLFNQSYSDCEFVFVDDCSPDRSISIIKEKIIKYGKCECTKIIRHDINEGLAKARLTGLTNATGELIMFVDSDDYLSYDAVQLLVNKMEETSCDIVTGGITHIFDDGKKYVELPPKGIDNNTYLTLLLQRDTFLNCFPRIFRRNLFENLKVPFQKGLNFGEDYLLISRIFNIAKSISFVNKPLYFYMHNNSASYTFQFKMSNFLNLIEIDKIILDFYKDQENMLQCHRIGRLKLKSEQLVLFLRSEKINKDDYKYLQKTFAEDQHSELIKCLHFQDKIILLLSELLPLRMMKSFVKYGYYSKHIMKLILQRYF